MKNNYKSIIFLLIIFMLIGLTWVIVGVYVLDYPNFKGNKKMQISKLTPNLMVKDVNKTVEFYESMLNFKMVISMPDTGSYDFAILSRDGIEIMFQKRESFVSELPQLCETVIGGSFALYIDVDDIESVYSKLKSHCEILKEMHNTFYGTKEFSCKDINGYILTFAETVE